MGGVARADTSRSWPCGHPRTESNSQRVGVGNGVRCRECRRRIARESAKRRFDAAKLSRVWRVEAVTC